MLKKLIIAAAVLASTLAHADTSVLVFGKSWHFDKHYNYDYNQVNYGLGVEWGPHDSGWFVGGYALKDSMNQLGYAAYGGYRYQYHIGDSGFHLDAAIRAGYIKDARYHGPGALPTVGVGYKHAALELAYIPKVNKYQAQALVLFGRYTF
jgi:hypothetical protein